MAITGVDSANTYFEGINVTLNDMITAAQSGDYNTNDYRKQWIDRTPWLMTTSEWIEKNMAIIWMANPSEVSWNMPLRQSTSKTVSGTVTHVWKNPARGTFFDEIKLTLSLQSGNLLPVYNSTKSQGFLDSLTGRPSSSTDINPSTGLLNFYDFIQLVDAPKLTVDGKMNYVIIKYNSTLFPNLTLIGQFDPSGIRFTDSSANPHSVTSWSADFIVMDTMPRLSVVNLPNRDFLTFGKGKTESMMSSIRNPALFNNYLKDIENNVRYNKNRT